MISARALPLRTSEIPAKFTEAGIDTDAFADQLKDQGAASFVHYWKELMACIVSKNNASKAA